MTHKDFDQLVERLEYDGCIAMLNSTSGPIEVYPAYRGTDGTIDLESSEGCTPILKQQYTDLTHELNEIAVNDVSVYREVMGWWNPLNPKRTIN